MRVKSFVRLCFVAALACLAACTVFIDTGGFSSGNVPPADATSDAPAGNDGSADTSTSEGSVDSGPLRYSSTVLEDKPILYYRFEETSGPAIKDETNNWPGTAGSITFGAPGAFPGSLAISLDGTKGWVSAGSAGDFVGTDNFTVECWVKPAVNDNVYRHPFNKDVDNGGGTARQQYGLFVHLGRIAFERYVDDQSISVETGVLPINAWYHAVATYDGKAMVLYIDGVQVQIAADARGAKPKPVPLYIAAKGPTYGFLNGSLDEVAVYDKALSAARVKAHFDSAKP